MAFEIGNKLMALLDWKKPMNCSHGFMLTTQKFMKTLELAHATYHKLSSTQSCLTIKCHP